MTSSVSKSFYLEYSDRFSPVDEFSYRERAKMSVTLSKKKLRGSGDALWVVSSVKRLKSVSLSARRV
jgi:hypothetical protein